MPEVWVTGIGAVTSLGGSWPLTWAALLQGRSGVVRDAQGYLVAPAPVDPALLLGRRTATRLDRCAQLAVLAAREAVAGAGWQAARAPGRTAVVIGSGLGGVASFETAVATRLARGPGRVSPYTTATMIPDAAATAVARDLGAQGPCLAPVSACASGADALALARDHILLGRADVVVCGGADAPLVPTVLAGFASMTATSRYPGDPAEACRPFDAARDGFVPAEGAAVLVLEAPAHARGRGVPALGRLIGAGATCDAHHPTSPEPSGAAAERALRAALEEAGVPAAGQVCYLNAHATGTPVGDRVEAEVLARVLGPTVAVSATKALTGHPMGASAALEAAVCLQALRTRTAPATQNLTCPEGPQLDHVRDAPRRLGPGVAVSTSFGFGGHNAALVLAAASGPD